MKQTTFNILALFFLLLSLRLSFAVNGAEIAVYTDNGLGAWPDGVVAFEQFLDWKGITHERVTAVDVNTLDLRDYYQAIYFPGGYAYYYKIEIDSAGLEHIRQLVRDGGGYIGICAGAYFASDSIDWEEDGLLDYPLNLFDGVSRGAIDDIIPWDSYTMTTVNMNPNNPINQYEPEQETMLYYGGQVFKPHAGVQVDTLATWAAYYDSLAAINFTYGQGRVVLLGPHPEIEEDSDRDSTTFADELDDQGSDWPFLWSAVDWLLGRPITYPPPSSIATKNGTKQAAAEFSVSPNPFNSQIKINLTFRKNQVIDFWLSDLRGRKVWQFYQGQVTPGSYQWRWTGINNRGISLSSSVYFLVLKSESGIQTKKIVLIK